LLAFKRTLPFVVLLCGSCSPGPATSWRDQLEPDGPCYDVDLFDGLDTDSPAEIDALYDCVDRNGHMDPFDATWSAAGATSRSGVAGHLELSRAVAALADLDVDVFAGLDAVLRLFDDDALRDDLVDVALELTWAAPAPFVRRGEISFDSSSALGEGAFSPMLSVAPELSRRLLESPDTRVALADLLDAPDTRRVVLTLGAISRSADDAAMVEALFRDAGSALAATSSPGNDRWTRASGQSLRDVATTFLDGDRPLINALTPAILPLLDDASLRRRLGVQVKALERAGHLAPFMSQLAGLASVNAEGRPLARGEDSALSALARLLATTNAPMRCTLDLWITDFEVDLGNVSVTLLDVVADWDPSTVQDATGVISDLLGYDLSSWLLDQVVDSEVCPLITAQTISDLSALERLYDPGKRSLVTAFLALLSEVDADLPERDIDHLQAVADLASALWSRGAMPAVEEVLRDTADEPFVADITALAARFVDPSGLDVEDPADWDLMLDAAQTLLDDRSGPSGWERLSPAVLPLVRRDDTWTAMDATARVLAHPTSTIGGAGTWLPRFINFDPDLESLHTAALAVGDDAVCLPALRVLEMQPVADALRAPGLDAPMPWLSRLAVDGTLAELFATIDVLIDKLGDANQAGRQPR
jgi:hypothetical protein